MTKPTRDERGVSAMAIGLPTALILAITILLAAGRGHQGNNAIHTAAQEAARAATREQYPGDAIAAAEAAAQQNLIDAGYGCDPATQAIDVNVANLFPGGFVTVSITCDVKLSDLFVGPGSYTFTGEATEVVDTYRGE